MTGALTTSPAITFTVTLQTPRQLSPVNVVLAATGSTTIGSATKITRPGTGFAAIANMGSGGISSDADSVLGDVWSLSPVTLRDRAHVLGKVYAPNVVVPGAAVHIDGGTDTTTSLIPATVTTWTVTYPATVVNDIVLQTNQTGLRAPGRYGSVQLFSGARLTLSSGTYFVDSLDLEPASKVILNQDAGPVMLYVRNSVILRGLFSTASGAAPDLLLGYLGASDVFAEVSFVGTMVAPSAKVVLRSVTGGHAGAFFGKNIEVSPNTTVTYRPGHPILSTQPPASRDKCSGLVQPNDALTGAEQELQYQKDILRYCTGSGMGSCEQTIRARMNVDFFAAARLVMSQQMPTGQYVQILQDRDKKMGSFRLNATLACDVVTHDGDGDYVPDGSDACRNTPSLTPVLANGCTNNQFPPGPSITEILKISTHIGINVDPRCVGAPKPAVPAPLGAFRSNDPARGKALWVSRDPGTSTCPLYYQIEFYLTDGLGRRTVTFLASENASLDWIAPPAGAVQFALKPTDPGDRAAWASYSVFTETFRARAFNTGGSLSLWSEFFTFSTTDCVAGQACSDHR
ncbi:MAG: hypothetical protein ABJA82_04100 [Myxococcales bacterium]